MVDWAGTTLPLYNPETGSVSKVYLFVATLLFSMHCYAEACRDMKEASWIQAYTHLADFLGGTPRLLVSDNLKTGILQNRKLLEIYYEGRRIASHKRILGHRGQYSTITEHMPMNHQLYSQWDGNRFRRWAQKCGIAALAVVEKQLASYRVEEQA